MPEMKTLEITGYKGKPIPNTFIPQPTSTSHLAILLPGYRHTADRADLHYTGRALREAGADLLRVDYTYDQTDFMAQSEMEQARWLSTDARAAFAAGLAQRPYDRITLIGKSIGTMAMGHLMDDPRAQGAGCIWLTPILTAAWLRSRIAQAAPRSLFVIGTADRFYDAGYLAEVVEATQGRRLVIEGAGHDLEIAGDIEGSLDTLEKIVTEVQQFIA